MTESDILARLYAAKAEVLALEKEREPLATLVERAAARLGERRSLRDAIAAARGPAIIAEIKRASPSKGLIVHQLDPAKIAQRYNAAGADAISVLTESDHFLGDLVYLDAARAAAPLPIMRKDFLTEPYQVVQSAAHGADAIIAIVAGLDDATIRALLEEAQRWRLDVLVEIHDERELERALALGATLLGINNRDLRTFETSLAVAEELLPRIPSSVLAISESGIGSPEDTKPLVDAGARGFLIGESLMRAEDPAELIRAIKAPRPISTTAATAVR
ncbi:MAG: indole-3-glycerol phosphate synthase TrpC [Candidatus Eremiobacteraeota bacterium]|nr:indole-3-glycerol phosphate synthase TrpC [Candidatus Eremiobacteraeota bacterium]